MIQGRREIRLPRFAGEISVDPGANRIGFIESAGEPSYRLSRTFDDLRS
jgi:hypothetical protein